MFARITIQDKEIEEKIKQLESQLEKFRQLARSIDRECSVLDIVFTSNEKRCKNNEAIFLEKLFHEGLKNSQGNEDTKTVIRVIKYIHEKLEKLTGQQANLDACGVPTYDVSRIWLKGQIEAYQNILAVIDRTNKENS
jgi:hypothetical protein